MSQIKMGALLSYLALILSVVISLVYTPIMIRTLGQAEYGVYSLMAAFVGYLTILDMGLGNAIVRYVARTRAGNDQQEESRLTGMFLILFTILGAVVGIIGVVMYFQIDLLFSDSLKANELLLAKQISIILIANFSISFPLSVFGALIQAHEKFVFMKVAGIVRTVIIPLITIPLLFMGYGSVMMVIISSLINIIFLLINVVYCFRRLKVRVQFRYFNKRLLKEVLIYSSFIFLNAIIDKIYWSTDQIILGSVTGANQVAIYAIAMQFIMIYMSISTAISGLFLPKVSIMEMKGATSKEFSDLFIKVGRIQAHILFFILGGFLLIGKQFLTLWVGIDYLDGYYIVLIIMTPLAVILSQNVGISILQAKNMHAFRSVLYLVISLINIVTSIFIADKYGGVGVALVTAGSLVIGNIIIMNAYYYLKLNINVKVLWIGIFKIIFSVCIPFVLINIININASLLMIITSGLIYSIITLLLMWFISMNPFEKQLLITIKTKLTK
ncbi:teichoic acid transporter [Sporosarcina sp. P13]|uniref:oligosaccharide flippase family protein n=1 Tax=Sporosarcina sp. P13 TaxID=2048263 RepID=UPI000C166419|nr:oligosaccharide flippase family protein [Sporosarcina sp. P13]PIC63986.1 teichoic acid transporter [Sporosarcina sp. P13]